MFLSFFVVSCSDGSSDQSVYSFGKIDSASVSHSIADSNNSSSEETSSKPYSSTESSQSSSSKNEMESWEECSCEWIYHKTTPATCTTDGEIEYICSKGCGNRKWEPIYHQGHVPGTEERENLKAEEPTCEKEGYTKGEYCKNCGITLVERTEIPRVDHDLIGNVECRWCGLCTLAFEVNDDEEPEYYICKGYALSWLMPRNIVIPDTYEGYPHPGLRLPVREIGERAFEREYGLNSITLGENIERIGEFAFNECHNLVEVCNQSKVEIVANSDENYEQNGLIGRYAKSVYASDEYESKIKRVDGFVVYEEGEEKLLIGYGDFKTEFIIDPPVNPLHITVPDGVTAIHSYAFAYIDSVESITLANSVNHLYTYAFSQAYHLKKVVFGNGPMAIDKDIFFRWKEETGDYIESKLEEVVSSVNVTLKRSYTEEERTFLAGENFIEYLTAILDEKVPTDPLDDVTNGDYKYTYTPIPSKE